MPVPPKASTRGDELLPFQRASAEQGKFKNQAVLLWPTLSNLSLVSGRLDLLSRRVPEQNPCGTWKGGKKTSFF